MSASASSSSSTGVSTAGLSETGAGAGRRVQPRHFSSGPNPVAAPDGYAAAASADGPPPAARLYRHALESIFAFLGQGELATALRVSRGWLAAVHSMRSLQLKISSPKVPIYVLAPSAMGRHVAAIGAPDARAALSADSLFVLAHFLPQLRELTCALPLPPAPAPLFFPAALRKLNLLIDAGRPEDVNAALQSIGRLPLLGELTLHLNVIDPLISFAPLAALPQLLDLHICSGGATPSDAQVDQLRALPQLHRLLVPMATSALRRLLRQPHDLRWQAISLPYALDDEAAALLLQLPSLTKINAMAGCERFDWLRGLPNLIDVCLSFKDAVVAAGCVDSLIAGLQCCTNIDILTLSNCASLTAAQLADLLPRLPRLRQLDLICLHIEALSFLAQPPLTSQLTTLGLWGCRRLPLAELRHVHALRGLKQLRLCSSFTALLDDYSQSLYEPPSLLLPQLESFIYDAAP